MPFDPSDRKVARILGTWVSPEGDVAVVSLSPDRQFIEARLKGSGEPISAGFVMLGRKLEDEPGSGDTSPTL